jgi:hypothetical protein
MMKARAADTVMPGHSRSQERRRFRSAYVPGIHVFFFPAPKTWMAGTRPAMTKANSDCYCPSPAPGPPAGDEQHDAGGTGDNAMLVMNARNTGFVAGKKARQLIGRKDEIEAGNDEEHDADKREDDFHELIPLEYDMLVWRH